MFFLPFCQKFLYFFFNRNTKIITAATATAAPIPISRMEDSASGGGEEVGPCEGEVVGVGKGLADGRGVVVAVGVTVGSDVTVEVGVGERDGDGSPMPNL